MLERLRAARTNADRGFTLIELLVVIIIIGILAAIAIPVYLNQRKKAVDASVKQDMQAMAKVQETWLVDNFTMQGFAIGPIAPRTMVEIGAPGTNGSTFISGPGTTVTVTLNTGNRGYCITATNPDSTRGTAAFYYDSANGGHGVTGCS